MGRPFHCSSFQRTHAGTGTILSILGRFVSAGLLKASQRGSFPLQPSTEPREHEPPAELTARLPPGHEARVQRSPHQTPGAEPGCSITRVQCKKEKFGHRVSNLKKKEKKKNRVWA